MALGTLQLEAQEAKGYWETIIQDLDRFSERFVFKSQACKWFFYLKDNSLASWAFSSLYFGLGMFSSSGLLDIINNPLGYQAKSEVWQEPSGFMWNADISSPKDVYFILNMLPTHLSLFLPLKIKDLWTCGLVANIPFFNFLNYEILFKASHSPSTSLEDDEWFLEKININGFFYQLAQRFLFQFSPFQFGFVLGTSWADLVAPALFLSLSFSYHTKPLSLYALFIYRSPNYIGKSLATVCEVLKLAINIKWQIFKWLALELDLMRKYDDHENLDLLQGFGQWFGQIKTIFDFYNKRQSLKIELVYKYLFESHYREAINQSQVFSIKILSKWIRTLSLELGYNLEIFNESLLHKLATVVKFNLNCFKLTTDLALEFADEVYAQVRLKLLSEIKPFDIWLGCELKRFELKEFGQPSEANWLAKLKSHLRLSLGIKIYY